LVIERPFEQVFGCDFLLSASDGGLEPLHLLFLHVHQAQLPSRLVADVVEEASVARRALLMAVESRQMLASGAGPRDELFRGAFREGLSCKIS
jgi:hypothetical protein